MKVTCNSCNKEFKVTKRKIKKEKVTDRVERQYFKCPHCKKKYIVSYFDNEIKENIKRMNDLKGQLLRKEITGDEYQVKYNNLKFRNITISNNYKGIFGR